MDIKEIAMKVGLQVFEEHPYDKGHVVSPSGYTWIDDKLIEFAEALIESYKAELLKEVGEPVAYFSDEFFSINTKQNATFNDPLFSSDQVAAAALKATKSLDKPIDPSLSAEIERTDWTPAEALQFYADQRNFDIVSGHARIIDNGAVASNALKHLSIERLELKGDAELAELRAQLAAAQEEIKTVTEQKNRMWFEMQTAQDQLAKAEQQAKELSDSVAQKVAEWQPIETAPKDGVWILCKSFRRLTTEQSREISWNGKCWATRDCSRLSDPTHWMPLPKAPTGASS